MVKTVKIGPYELGRELGRGATGTVYEAVDPLRNVTVAVKALKHSQTSKKNMLHEIKVMKDLGHENTVRFFTVFHEKAMSYLVLEVVGGGELFDTVVKWKRETRERSTFHYFFQLMSGVKYLHQAGYAHRDLKLENLLLSKDGILKIADFGVSKEIALNPMKTCCGSPDYIAPEILGDKPGYNGQLADIWSCGVILYTMLCGEFPFENTQHIMQAKYKVPRWCPKLAKESCIDKILVVDPSKRLQSADAVLETEWCRSFSAGKNSFGMLRDILLRRLRGPRAKFRRLALEVIIQIKVIAAFGRASFKGTPRDIRLVTSDRLKSVLRVLTAYVRPTVPSMNRVNSFGSESSSFKGNLPSSSSNPPRSPFGKKVLNISPFGKKLGGWFGQGSHRIIVDEKEVNWKGLRTSSDYLLQMKLLQEVERANIVGLSRDELLAVYLNMYHLMMINGFVMYGKHLGEMTDEERKSFYNEITYIIAYSQMSLNDLQHGILRCNGKLPSKGLSGFFGVETQFDSKRDQEKIEMMLPEFEPMIHFALSTMSISSYRILVYECSALKEQIAKATQDFLSGSISVDLEQHAVRLPPIFNLFPTDFGATKSEMLSWIRDHLNDAKRREFSLLLDKGIPTITYMPFLPDFKWFPVQELDDWISTANSRFVKPANWRFEQVVENEISIREEIKGSRKIDITIIAANHLPKMDLIGTIDAFCVVSFNNLEYKSSVKKGTFQPEWQETFSFRVSDVTANPTALRVTVMHWDRMHPSEPIGEVNISAERMSQILRAPDGWEEDRIRHIIQSGKAAQGFDKQLSTLRLQLKAHELEEYQGDQDEKSPRASQSGKKAEKSSRRRHNSTDSALNTDDDSTPRERPASLSSTRKATSPSRSPDVRTRRRRSSEDISAAREINAHFNRAKRRSSIDILDHRDLLGRELHPEFLQRAPKSRSSGDLLKKDKKVSSQPELQAEEFKVEMSVGDASPSVAARKKKSANKSSLAHSLAGHTSSICNDSLQQSIVLPGLIVDTVGSNDNPMEGEMFADQRQISPAASRRPSVSRSNSRSPDIRSSSRSPDIRVRSLATTSNSFNLRKPSKEQKIMEEAIASLSKKKDGEPGPSNEDRTVQDFEGNLTDIAEGSMEKWEETGMERNDDTQAKGNLSGAERKATDEIVNELEGASSHQYEKMYDRDDMKEIVEIMADGWKERPSEAIQADEEINHEIRELNRRISLRKLSLTAEQVLEGEARRKLVGSYDYSAMKEKQPEIKLRYSAKKKKNHSSCSIL